MALTVVNPSYQQQRVPFWERVGTDLLLPVLSDMWKTHRQNEQNRKENASIAKTLEDIMPQTQTQMTMPMGQGGMLGGNGWENAFHSMQDNPLEQFDAGTSGVTPQLTQTQLAPPSSQMPVSAADFTNAMIRNLGTKRFGMLDPKRMQELAAPYLANLEKARQEYRQKELANAIMNAGNSGNRLSQVWGGATEGLIPTSAISQALDEYKYNNPYYQFSDVDAGDKKIKLSVNPITGEVTPRYVQDVSVSPNTQATLDANAKLENRRLGIQEKANDRSYHISNRQQNELETQGKYNRDNPALQFETDVDGNYFAVNPRTGQVTEVTTPDGKQVKISKDSDIIQMVDENNNIYLWDRKTGRRWHPTDENGNGLHPVPRITNSNNSNNTYRDITKSDELRFNALKDEATKLRDELKDANSKISLWQDDPEELARLNKRKDEINARLDEIRKEQDEITGVNKKTGNSGLTVEDKVDWTDDNGGRGYMLVDGKKYPLTARNYEALRKMADAGQLQGIKSGADLDALLTKKGLKRTNAASNSSTSPKTVSNGAKIMPPLSSDVSAPVSPDVQNRATSADSQAQVDKLNGDTVTSPDIPSTTSNDETMATPAPRKKGDIIEIDDDDLPDVIWYNTDRDKDTPKEKILTKSQFEAWVGRMLAKPEAKNFTPEQIIQRVLNQGFKIKRDASSVSMLNNPSAPEESGTTFNGEKLPGLRAKGAYAASLTPMGMGKSTTQDSRPMDYGNYPPPYNPNNGNTTQQTTTPQPTDEGNYLPPYNPNGSYIMPPTSENVSEPEAIDPRVDVGGRAKRPAAPKPRRAAPAPRRGYTSYEQQRTHVDNAAKTHGIDSELIRAVIQTESNWNPKARSKVGAMGLMQLMPATARSLGVKNAYDSAQNIAGGSKYLAQLIRQFGGDVSKALMAYNCGAGNVRKGRIPKASRAYANKVMGIYRELKGQL